MADVFLTLGTGLKWLGYFASPLWLLPFILIAVGRPLAGATSALSGALDRVSDAALSVAMICAVLIVMTQLAVVFARYVFGLSFSWLSESVVYSFAAMFLLAASGALKADEHVRVDILRERFGEKGRAAIELGGIYLFLVPICLVILWSAISPSFVRSWASFEASRESDGLPILFLFRSLVPAFAILLLLQGLSEALKAAKVLKGLSTRGMDAAHRGRG